MKLTDEREIMDERLPDSARAVCGQASVSPLREVLGPDQESWVLSALRRLVEISGDVRARNWPSAGDGVKAAATEAAVHATAAEVIRICGREPEFVNVQKPRYMSRTTQGMVTAKRPPA